jgi:hypothetical protein
MNKQSIKKNLHKYIDTIEDSNYLKVIHDLVSLKAEESSFDLSEKEKAVLDERMKKHISGESRNYTWEEVKRSMTVRKKK